MTGRVVMDQQADREPDYWFWQLTPDSDHFEYWTDIQVTGDDVSIIEN